MKKIMLLGVAAAFVASSLVTKADDSLRGTKSVTRDSVKMRNSDGPADRKLEVRVGPRISFLSGDVRVGGTGTPFDIWDDTGLDEPSAGVQFDADWQPWNRVHIAGGVTWDKYDHSGTTKKDLSREGSTERLLAGAPVSADVDVVSFEGKVGYDVIKNNTYRLQPYIGGKGWFLDGKTSFSGTRINSAGVALAPRTDTFKDDQTYGAFFGGVDQRLYVSRSWYVGGDIGATGMDRWYYLTGDAYTGYDFNKTWGVRAGYAYDFASYENRNKTTKAEPLLGAVYVQAVWGF